MRVADVFAALRLDTTEFRKGLEGLNSQVNTASRDWGRSLSSFGRSTQKLGRTMTTNLTLPILAAGGASAKFALDFDTTLRRVVGLTDVTADQIGGIREQILAMGTDIGKGPQELAEAFYFVASAGFEAEEAMKVLEIAAKASASGMGETQDIAKILGAAINAYGKENLTAAQAGDILTAAVSDGAAEADAFAGVLGRVIPVAASMGVSFDQVTAALAAMTLSGVDADEAATGLRQILASLLKPTNEAEDALRGLGLSSEELRRQLREEGLLATLRTLDERFAGNAAATAEVFGNVRALTGINNLLNLSQEQLAKVFDDTADSVGHLNQTYEDTAGPQREIDKAMAELQATAIELGQDVLPVVVGVLQGIADGAREVAKWWRSLDEGTRTQIVQWLAWIAVAGPALLLIGKLASGLGALFRAVAFLTGAKGIPALAARMPALAGAITLALGPLALLAAALGGLIIIADQVDRALNPVEAAFDDLAKASGKSAKQVWDQTKALADRFHQPVEEIEQLIIEAAAKYGLEWDEAFDHVEANLRLHGGEVVDGFETIGYHARQALAEHTDGIVDDMGNLPSDMADGLSDGTDEVGASAGEMAAEIAKALAEAKQDAADAANDIISTIASVLSSNPKELRDAAQAMIDDILHPFSDARHALEIESILARKIWVQGLTSPDSGDRARTAEYLKGLLAEYEELPAGILDIGALTNPAFRDGIESTLAALVTYIEDTTGNIVDQYDLADQLERMGYDSLAGYVRGQARADFIEGTRVRTNITRDVKSSLAIDLWQEGYNTGASYGNGLEYAWDHYIRSKAQQIRDGVGGFLEFSGSPPYTYSRQAGEGVGRSWIDALVESIRAGSRDVMAATSGLLNGGFTPFGSYASPSLAPVAVAAAPAAAGSTTTTVNNFNLNYSGRKDRDEVEEILEEWQRMGRL